MLVISRKEGESIEIPGIGLSLEILRTANGSVKLGIKAPREVKVLRGELQPPRIVTPPVEKANYVAEPSENYCVSS